MTRRRNAAYSSFSTTRYGRFGVNGFLTVQWPGQTGGVIGSLRSCSRCTGRLSAVCSRPFRCCRRGRYGGRAWPCRGGEDGRGWAGGGGGRGQRGRGRPRGVRVATTS